MNKKLIKNFIITLVVSQLALLAIMLIIWSSGQPKQNVYNECDPIIIRDYIMTGDDTHIESKHDYNNDGQVRANDYLMIKEIELGLK